MTERYQITSLIEKDQLGSVYLAQDTTLQRKVVFRTFEAGQSKKRLEGFSQYTGKLCALQHPNLLTIFDIAQNDEGYFMVTQLIEGESLVDRLSQGALNYVGVHNMVCDLLDALHAAHSSGLFHGALRADSVKRLSRVRGGHRYIIVDFGLDRISAMICGTHVIMADPVLMAPELLGYTQEPDSQSDLFTLGQLCYIALVGGHPYAGKSQEECAQAYRDGGLPHLNTYVQGVQQEFADWVMWLVAGSPDQRPASSQEAMQALHAIKLKAPSPNVPGVTQAVDVPDAPDPQKPKISEAVRVTSESTSTKPSKPAKAAKRPKASGEPKGRRLLLAAAGTVICLLVILILILVFRDDSSGASTKGGAVSGSGQAMAILQETKSYDLLLTKNHPVNIQLDGAKTVDWTVVTGAPASSERLLMKGGSYIRNILALGKFTEFVEEKKTITYRAGGSEVQPQRGLTSSNRGSAKEGEGWEVVLRIPETHKGDLLVTFYMIQVRCDFSIEVRSSQKEQENQVARYTVPQELPGLVAIPLLIPDPSPGYYSVRVLASSVSLAPGFEMGLSAILLEKA